MNNIVDLHMHAVFGVDDGSRSIEESLQMLRLAATQGVRDVFCTSHNGWCKKDSERYAASFSSLKDALDKASIDVRIHTGCEILCDAEYIDAVACSLDTGAFSTLGSSRYVLAELYTDTSSQQAHTVVKALIKHGYKPVIAHMERNLNISVEETCKLIKSGALIQVNAFSFVDETDEMIRERARDLLDNKCIHFIGSDAHRIDHRPPNILSGARYIIENTDSEYADRILSGNLSLLLEG